MKKFQGTKSLLRPEPGQERKIHARAGDSNVAAEIRHGVNTKTSNYVRFVWNRSVEIICKFVGGTFLCCCAN